MFLVLSAARMRRRLTTSASLKSNEMSREPFDGCRPAGRAGAGVAWAMRTGAGGGGATSGLAGASGFAGAGDVSAGGLPFRAIARLVRGAGGQILAGPLSQ